MNESKKIKKEKIFFPSTRVSEAWRHGFNGSGITIAVLDYGIQVDHPDLRRNIVRIIQMMLI